MSDPVVPIQTFMPLCTEKCLAYYTATANAIVSSNQYTTSAMLLIDMGSNFFSMVPSSRTLHRPDEIHLSIKIEAAPKI